MGLLQQAQSSPERRARTRQGVLARVRQGGNTYVCRRGAESRRGAAEGRHRAAGGHEYAEVLLADLTRRSAMQPRGRTSAWDRGAPQDAVVEPTHYYGHASPAQIYSTAHRAERPVSRGGAKGRLPIMRDDIAVSPAALLFPSSLRAELAYGSPSTARLGSASASGASARPYSARSAPVSRPPSAPSSRRIRHPRSPRTLEVRPTSARVAAHRRTIQQPAGPAQHDVLQWAPSQLHALLSTGCQSLQSRIDEEQAIARAKQHARRKRSATVAIQSTMRGRFARLRIWRLHGAATRIQALIRRNVAVTNFHVSMGMVLRVQVNTAQVSFLQLGLPATGLTGQLSGLGQAMVRRFHAERKYAATLRSAAKIQALRRGQLARRRAHEMVRCALAVMAGP